ncbi:hypothetical protein LCGC14_2290090 [marine sediment metagenome]|uniref:Uncharacterized protein n=1 Tax=marine sediment metagenome TaxID=412755 RepID=A0A0F9CRF4_9ZZZZ
MKGLGWVLAFFIAMIAVGAFTLGFSLGDAFGANLEECRNWTTGQAGDSSTPCDGGSNYAGTLRTVGILLVFIGLSALAFWALFRRG